MEDGVSPFYSKSKIAVLVAICPTVDFLSISGGSIPVVVFLVELVYEIW